MKIHLVTLSFAAVLFAQPAFADRQGGGNRPYFPNGGDNIDQTSQGGVIYQPPVVVMEDPQAQQQAQQEQARQNAAARQKAVDDESGPLGSEFPDPDQSPKNMFNKDQSPDNMFDTN